MAYICLNTIKQGRGHCLYKKNGEKKAKGKTQLKRITKKKKKNRVNTTKQILCKLRRKKTGGSLQLTQVLKMLSHDLGCNPTEVHKYLSNGKGDLLTHAYKEFHDTVIPPLIKDLQLHYNETDLQINDAIRNTNRLRKIFDTFCALIQGLPIYAQSIVFLKLCMGERQSFPYMNEFIGTRDTYTGLRKTIEAVQEKYKRIREEIPCQMVTHFNQEDVENQLKNYYFNTLHQVLWLNTLPAPNVALFYKALVKYQQDKTLGNTLLQQMLDDTPVRVPKKLYRVQKNISSDDIYKLYPYLSTSFSPFFYIKSGLNEQLLIIQIENNNIVPCLMMPCEDETKIVELEALIKPFSVQNLKSYKGGMYTCNHGLLASTMG